MKAEKLPSGSWRIRVYLGKDENGKSITKSVTAKTKAEVFRKAAQYGVRIANADLRVGDACQQYLEYRGLELSPSTLRGYYGTYNRYIEPDRIAVIKLEDLKTPTVQEWVARFPREMSSKSKKNHLGFLLAVVSYFTDGEKTFKVKIRDATPPDMYVPTMDEVNKVLSVADPILKRAILLGLFGMRRGEICALEGRDVDRRHGLIRINKALAKGPDGTWVTKAPKTRDSVRWVEVPAPVIDILPLEDRLVPILPDVVTLRFVKAVKRAGVPHFRFHDLRAFFASICVSSAIGAGELTVQQIGGWKTNNVLKRHYERTISDQRQKDTEKILAFFSDHLAISDPAQ